jgi:hypothetical protein
MNESKNVGFDTANITALSHLYRGELYRSTVWRTRLDATTNWAVVTTGLALSLTFSSETASPPSARSTISKQLRVVGVARQLARAAASGPYEELA